MTLTTLLTIGAGAIAVALASSFALPRHVEITRSTVMSVDPADILTLAASSRGYQRFNPYLSNDPELKITPFGPASGVGAGFHFDGRDGRGSQTVADVTPHSVRYDIDLGAMGQPEQEIIAKPHPKGAEVIWRMRADLGRNPVARVFGLFMDRMIGKTFEQGLANLATAA